MKTLEQLWHEWKERKEYSSAWEQGYADASQQHAKEIKEWLDSQKSRVLPKSLTAKAIGAVWRLPLLKMDVGALFGGFVGESEERTRRALSVAETVAPVTVVLMAKELPVVPLKK